MAKRAWWLRLVVVGALALGACGSGDAGATGVATLGDGESAGAADGGDTDDEPTEQEREDAMLAFAACMREHGIDVQDPQVVEGDGGGGVAIRVGPGPGEGGGATGGPPIGGPDEEAFEAAHEACGHIMEDVMGEPPAMDPEEQARHRDEMLAYAQCMREHGIDMPDPEFGAGGRVSMKFVGGDVDDEVMEAAQEACGDLMGGGGLAVSSSARP